MSLQTAIDKLNASRKAYEDQLKELGKDLGKEVAAHLGALIPEGFVVEWKQGTPSFNDGDPCRFSVRDAYIYRVILNENGEDPFDGEHPEDRGYVKGEQDPRYRSFYLSTSESYGREKTYGTGPSAVTYPAESLEGLSIEQFDALSAAWSALPKDLMERAFGDGAHVKLKAGGEYTNDEYYE